ncbi:hypothetical protein [Spirosoma linguale]|uniref:hypothetical protein n=1 Tax=Spirosoma linguale TaxID=108 RepID=UPI0002E44635
MFKKRTKPIETVPRPEPNTLKMRRSTGLSGSTNAFTSINRSQELPQGPPTSLSRATQSSLYNPI